MRPSRSRRTLPALALLLLLLPALVSAQVNVVPTDVQQPGTQPLEASLQNLSKCDNCHGGYDAAVEPVRIWRGSLMAHAARDPLYWATVAIAEQDFPGAGDLCLRCHTPDGWLAGHSTPTDGSGLSANEADGVTCDSCHRMVDPDTAEWAGQQFAPFLAHDESATPEGYYGGGMYVMGGELNLKFGPYLDIEANHGTQPSNFHRSSDFCGTCHDVSNPVVGDLAPSHGAQLPLEPGTFSGVPGSPVEGKAAFNNYPYQYGVVERTYSEHMASVFPTTRVSQFGTLPGELQAGAIEAAHDAAMASTDTGDYVDGDPRFFTCQTCHMPPVHGKGVNKASAPVRDDLPYHDLTGGSSWMDELIAHMDGRGELVLGGGLSAGELEALADGGDRARTQLQLAAALEVEGDTLKVVNLTGHKLISGYPEGRRMWVNVKWYDAGGALLREDGEYGPIQVVHDEAPMVVDSLVDLHDPHTKVYAAHYGMTQEWAALLVSLGFDPLIPAVFDRLDGSVTTTLGDVAELPPGSGVETFHFVLDDTILEDNRIPPYGFDYDEARVRNVLPVPADQYGDPGPGGTYEHWDELQLAPPTGAVSADIALLYQSTSWEYIQFLELANHGGVAFLAETGEHLREGWQATGMAPPEVMATATWTGDAPDPWTDLGHALAGTVGEPLLVGDGSLAGGSTLTLSLSNALPGGTTYLVFSVFAIDVPFKGGVLVPRPDIVLPLPVDGGGALELAFAWPTGIMGGTPTYWQHWIPDAGGPVGFAASNAILGVTP